MIIPAYKWWLKATEAIYILWYEHCMIKLKRSYLNKDDVCTLRMSSSHQPAQKKVTPYTKWNSTNKKKGQNAHTQ